MRIPIIVATLAAVVMPAMVPAAASAATPQR